MIGRSTLAQLPYLRDYESRRASSYDPSGCNNDWWTIQPRERRTLLNESRPGCVKHIWMTLGGAKEQLRTTVLRMYWDGETEPSVEAPIGDFFGMGHCEMRNFVSLPLQMSPEDGRGFNCWFPMPFDQARIEVENDWDQPMNLYFYIDYETYDRAHPEGVARFHAQWRREACTEGWLRERLGPDNVARVWAERPNLSDRDNYVILEAEGSGIYVGCNLNVDCFQRQGNDWYGEGDDMVVIDGEPWPPRMHGTGTEDYFCTAFGPRTVYSAPYHGITLYSGTPDWPWKGKNSMYRFHIEDPIRFRKSIRVSIEHGSSNKLSNDYSSTAYWYQIEPHRPFGPLPPAEARLPRPNEPVFPPNE
ncbi:MAG: glycoside hydrolase family 172 protein [Fimbriimonadaceae bacterium]